MISDNTMEGQIYNNLSDLKRKELYLYNNPGCYSKNNKHTSPTELFEKEPTNFLKRYSNEKNRGQKGN